MLFDRALSLPVLSGCSCREFVPGVCAGSLCREFVPGVRAWSSCRDLVPGVIQGGSGFVLRFYVVCIVCSKCSIDPGGDSVRTGLPVLVSSHVGDCGRLLLILLCYYLAELCLCLWCTSRTGPTPHRSNRGVNI